MTWQRIIELVSPDDHSVARRDLEAVAGVACTCIADEALAEDPVATEEYRILVERWERAEARILKYYAAQGMLRTAVIDTLAKQLVVTVLGAFADYLMSPSDTPKPAVPPRELVEQVEISSQNIVQGIT